MARTSKFTREVLAEAVAASASIAGVLRHLGVPWSGGMHAHISRRIKFFELDTTHFTGSGHNRGLTSPDRRTPEQILCPTASPVRGDWNGLPPVLHVDHVNGNSLDSRPSNVRFLCPNCHSQTPSWAGRNKRKNRYRLPPQTQRPIRIEEVLCLRRLRHGVLTDVAT
jgi:hypothetical protein